MATCQESLAKRFNWHHKEQHPLDKGQMPRLRVASYGFWCSGIDPDILLPRTKGPEYMRRRLKGRIPWESLYDQCDEPQLLRSQFPGSTTFDVAPSRFEDWGPYDPSFDV